MPIFPIVVLVILGFAYQGKDLNIGVQKGLKIPWGKPCAGSSPAVRTNKVTA
jgi:hypothetical protein